MEILIPRIMIKNLSLLAVAALFFLSGCEKVIEFKGDETDPMVVLSSEPEAGAPWLVSLTYSQFFLFNEPITPIDNAQVSVTVNGRGAGAARLLRDGVYSTGVVPQSGDSLELQVQVPGQPSVRAACRVPSAPVVREVSVSADTAWHFDEYASQRLGDSLWECCGSLSCRFVLDDPAGQKNYYMLRAAISSAGQFDGYSCDVTLHVDDKVLFEDNPLGELVDVGDDLSSGSRVLFSDDNINGKSHTVTFSTSDLYCLRRKGRGDLRIDIVSISRELYFYLATARAAASSGNALGLFSEPVQVICNVENGIGILGAAAAANLITE